MAGLNVPSDGTFHPDLARLLAAIEAAEAEATGLLRGLTEAQLNWQPENGRRWSIAQCLDHLIRMNPFYSGHFRRAMPQSGTGTPPPFCGLSPTWFGRWFIGQLDAPPKRRLRAPAVTVPASTVSTPHLNEAFVRSHDDYRALVRAANTVDVNRVTAPNPFVKGIRMRVSTVLLIIPAHDRRHLWQARQVLKAPGFPR